MVKRRVLYIGCRTRVGGMAMFVVVRGRRCSNKAKYIENEIVEGSIHGKDASFLF
jgi:hypothetical protein